MAGEALRMGPFVGGLNTASDPTAIADQELVTCLNFDLDLDGSLLCRTPLKEIAAPAGTTERIRLIGSGVFSGIHYVIGSNTNGVYYYTGGSWTQITSTFEATVAIQYNDFVYLVRKPGSGGNGGKWSPSGGFVAVAAIPAGEAAVIHKERLWIAPGVTATATPSRLKYSNAADFDTWGASDFFDVRPGDGTNLLDLTTYQDNLVLFKNNSTFYLAFDIRPADAVIQNISLNIGVDKQRCLINYENEIYILHQGWVYQLIQLEFNRLNTKVPFVRDDTAPTPFDEEDRFVSVMEDRLICRYFRKIYVYSLRTKTWSEWESASDTLHYFGPLVMISPSTGREFYAGSCLTANKSMIQLRDKHTSSAVEETLAATFNIICTAKTKNFDMAIPHQFKKLHHWGADVLTDNSIDGTATPIIVVFNTTWDAASSSTWDDLNTWDQPLTTSTAVSNTVAAGTGTARRAVRFPMAAAMRFRQVNFQVELTSSGSTADGPATIFTMAAWVDSRQLVPRSVN